MKLKKLVLAMCIAAPLTCVRPFKDYNLQRLHQSPNYMRSFQPKKWWISVDLGHPEGGWSVSHHHLPKSYARHFVQLGNLLNSGRGHGTGHYMAWLDDAGFINTPSHILYEECSEFGEKECDFVRAFLMGKDAPRKPIFLSEKSISSNSRKFFYDEYLKNQESKKHWRQHIWMI